MQTEPIRARQLPERLKNESQRWFSRFITYALDGSSRSLERAWRKEEEETFVLLGNKGAKGSKGHRPSGAWFRAFQMYQWVERATTFDAAVFAAEAKMVDEERGRERARRRLLVNNFLTFAEECLRDRTAMQRSPASISALVVRALEAHRREWGSDILPEDRMGAPYPGGVPGVIIQIEGGSDEDNEIVPLKTPSP